MRQPLLRGGHPKTSTLYSFFFFITLGLELSGTTSLRALNTSPPRNRFAFLRSSCSKIGNCTYRYSSRFKNSPSGPLWRSSDVQYRKIELESEGGRVGASFQDLPLLVEAALAFRFRVWGSGFRVQGSEFRVRSYRGTSIIRNIPTPPGPP